MKTHTQTKLRAPALAAAFLLATAPALAAATVQWENDREHKAVAAGSNAVPAKSSVQWQFARPDSAFIEVTDTPDAKLNIFSSHPTLEKGRFYYTDRSYGGAKLTFPAWLEGNLFYELTSKNPHTYRCTRDGRVVALAPVNPKRDLTPAMTALGFARDAHEPFQFFTEDSANIFASFTKNLRVGDTFTLPPWVLLAGFDVPRKPLPGAGELLYNGLRFPDPWPPKSDWKHWAGNLPPPEAPWLKNRPAVVPIDIGRQLLVDDFLVETTDLEREFHYPEKFSGNPVLKPETEIELKGSGDLAGAGPKSGGLWWSPEKQIFELWYAAGWVRTIAYATSRDGIHWDRPNLPLKPGTNQVIPSDIPEDSSSIVRDYDTADPQKKFKLFLRSGRARDRARYFTSPDGIDWTPVRIGGLTGDRSTMFYNPFRKKWVFTLRWNSPQGRSRAYWEADDFERGMNWLPDEPFPWTRADKLDLPDPRIGDKTQLYNLDAVAYESLMLGFFEILHGPGNNIGAAKGIPKFTGLNFAYSRDGFNWHRPDRKMAINSEQTAGKWDRGYVQSLNNICVIRGDKLWFYYIGFAGDENVRMGENGVLTSMRSGLYANAATGIATLRRDGFASLNAGASGGSLLTRPVKFSGSRLFVNADAPRGTLRAEICDESGAPIAPYTLANSIPFTGDSTLAPLTWKTGGKITTAAHHSDLSALAGKTIRIRFNLTNGKLYSFWVSRDATGRSDGYVAGGGPGFTGATDTVGKAALDAEAKFSDKQ
ncbi:MAG: hypothetical protein LBM92_00115 [Opitutaceae bacterium]|jgi:hypothetical protein|nr:hypothetical protein [Opitutaceae bacterium]